MSRLLSWIMGSGSPSRTAATVRRVTASSFDIARTSEHNEKHWAYASMQNAIDAMSPDVRRTAAIRARYELRNNSWLAGIVRTKANDAIGVGPRLQLTTDDRELNQRLERAWAAWSRSIRLALKLRSAMIAKMVDGEVFGTPVTNAAVRGPILLDLRLIHSTRVTSGYSGKLREREVDGIVYDEDWNPVEYLVEDLTPSTTSGAARVRPVNAKRMLHWFRPESVEQIRGISELAPSLGLFAELRRFREATLAAAETAANYAGVLQTDQPPNQDPESYDAFDAVELEARSLITLPAGWEMKQLDAKYPAVGYREYVEVLINEAARSALTPFNVAVGNSSSYNYASGRLDFQTYYRELGIERDDCETAILDPLLAEFIREAAGDQTLRLPPSMRDAIAVPHSWRWPGLTHADPVKEAQAARIRLESRLTTLSREYAAEGLDWIEEIAQTEAEEQELAKRGLTRFAAAQPYQQQTPSQDGEDGDTPSKDTKETSDAA